MFLLPIPTFRRAGIILGVAVAVCTCGNPRFTCAQGASAASNPEAAASSDHAHIEEVLNGLSRGRSVGQVAVSPDGRQLVWIQHASEGVEIRVAPLDDLTQSQRITAAAKPEQHCDEGNIAWSPDSKELAFFSDCAKLDEQTDLYVSHLDGSAPQRLTELDGYVDAPAFSPDGTQVAFLYVAGATRPAGALAAMKPPAGVIGEDGVEIQRVAVAPVNAAKPAVPELATPPGLHVYEFDWSPDSKSLAYVAADPPGENNWWVAKLYTQALDGVASSVVLAPSDVTGPLRGMQIAVPRWSPDGKAIAFIGGLMSDQGATGGDVWVVPSIGGQPRDLTPQRPTSPAWIEWDGNEHIYVSELAGGNCQLVRMRLASGPTGSSVRTTIDEPVFSIPGLVGDGRLEQSLSSTADRSLFVFRASTYDRPPEVYAAKATTAMQSDGGGFAGLTQLSHLNDGVEPGWGRSVSLSWTNEGFHVQGWLMLPKDYDPAKKYPLIVEVHGGPAAAEIAHWSTGGILSPAAFSALGYFVLQPNPRGSFGQGEEFTRANRKDFGYGDLRDILAGVDAVESQYPVDAGRVGLTGWSYGGFMTMFAVTQTQRFKAAVAGAGISDWLSYYGENSIDQWMIPYFGASVYDDPAVYAKSSAIDFVKQARTPTLFLVGDRDGECPAPQSYELWHALRDRHVPSQLVVYPNEGHGFVDPAHRRDVMERALEWFQKSMPPAE
jgi:dipeptidyl aminopeptidase/acylaminoacyl peptidase